MWVCVLLKNSASGTAVLLFLTRWLFNFSLGHRIIISGRSVLEFCPKNISHGATSIKRLHFSPRDARVPFARDVRGSWCIFELHALFVTLLWWVIAAVGEERSRRTIRNRKIEYVMRRRRRLYGRARRRRERLSLPAAVRRRAGRERPQHESPRSRARRKQPASDVDYLVA